MDDRLVPAVSALAGAVLGGFNDGNTFAGNGGPHISRDDTSLIHGAGLTGFGKGIESDPSSPRYILTEPWVGYRFNPGAWSPSHFAHRLYELFINPLRQPYARARNILLLTISLPKPPAAPLTGVERGGAGEPTSRRMPGQGRIAETRRKSRQRVGHFSVRARQLTSQAFGEGQRTVAISWGAGADSSSAPFVAMR